MKALFNFFRGLNFAFLISISLSFQLYASDCGCSKTGTYVKPAKGVIPDLTFSTVTEAFSPGGTSKLSTAPNTLFGDCGSNAVGLRFSSSLVLVVFDQ